MRSSSFGRYEEKYGLPHNYLNALVTAHGKEGAFQQLERGKLSMRDFLPLFGEQMSDVELGNAAYREYCRRVKREVPELPTSLNIDGAELWEEMMREVQTLDDAIVRAVVTLRQAGFICAALTNNWASDDGDKNAPDRTRLKELFDHFIESSVVGLRKPDPAFFQHALDLLEVKGDETAFLDDIGINLKAAAKLGIHGIRVAPGRGAEAVKQLGELVGVDLLAQGKL